MHQIITHHRGETTCTRNELGSTTAIIIFCLSTMISHGCCCAGLRFCECGRPVLPFFFSPNQLLLNCNSGTGRKEGELHEAERSQKYYYCQSSFAWPDMAWECSKRKNFYHKQAFSYIHWSASNKVSHLPPLLSFASALLQYSPFPFSQTSSSFRCTRLGTFDVFVQPY